MKSYDVPLDVQNETQMLSRFFFYSSLVCLLGFWLRNAALVKVIGNPISDGTVYKNEPLVHLAGCVRGFSSDSGLSGAASRLVRLSNYCI